MEQRQPSRPPHPAPAAAPPWHLQSAEVTMCGCFSSGHAEGEVGVDGSVYRAGDVARLSLRVTNHSKRPFKAVKVGWLAARTSAIQEGRPSSRGLC